MGRQPRDVAVSPLGIGVADGAHFVITQRGAALQRRHLRQLPGMQLDGAGGDETSQRTGRLAALGFRLFLGVVRSGAGLGQLEAALIPELRELVIDGADLGQRAYRRWGCGRLVGQGGLLSGDADARLLMTAAGRVL